jgi:hypothetical protein
MHSIVRRWKIVTVSVAFNALGWLGGAVEVFVVLWLPGATTISRPGVPSKSRLRFL